MKPPTRKVRAILYSGRPQEPDIYDDLQAEARSAVEVAGSQWCPHAVAEELRRYANACLGMLAKALPEPASPPIAPVPEPLLALAEISPHAAKIATLVEMGALTPEQAAELAGVPAIPMADRMQMAKRLGHGPVNCCDPQRLAGMQLTKRHGYTLETLREEVRRRSGISEPPRTLLVDRLGFERIDGSHAGARYVIVPFRPEGGGHGQANFEFWGETVRNGETLLEYREEGSRQVTLMPPPPAAPSLDALTRALWETDPQVVAFVERVGEADAAAGKALADSPPALWRDDRRARAMGIAWERREPAGSRERAETRAQAVLPALRGL